MTPENLSRWAATEAAIEREIGPGAGWKALKIIFDDWCGEKVPVMAALYRTARNQQIRARFNALLATGGEVKPTYTKLAAEFGLSARHIRRIIHE